MVEDWFDRSAAPLETLGCERTASKQLAPGDGPFEMSLGWRLKRGATSFHTESAHAGGLAAAARPYVGIQAPTFSSSAMVRSRCTSAAEDKRPETLTNVGACLRMLDEIPPTPTPSAIQTGKDKTSSRHAAPTVRAITRSTRQERLTITARRGDSCSGPTSLASKIRGGSALFQPSTSTQISQVGSGPGLQHRRLDQRRIDFGNVMDCRGLRIKYRQLESHRTSFTSPF